MIKPRYSSPKLLETGTLVLNLSKIFKLFLQKHLVLMIEFEKVVVEHFKRIADSVNLVSLLFLSPMVLKDFGRCFATER